METNELYEKVRTAPIGARMEHNGKVGVVQIDYEAGECTDCIYYDNPRHCKAQNTTSKSPIGLCRLPCVAWHHESGEAVIVRELKEGVTC